jgi:hypothetical protein
MHVLEAQSLSTLQVAESQLSVQNIQVAFTHVPLKQSPSLAQVAPPQYYPVVDEHEVHMLLMHVFEAQSVSEEHFNPEQRSVVSDWHSIQIESTQVPYMQSPFPLQASPLQYSPMLLLLQAAHTPEIQVEVAQSEEAVHVTPPQ